MKGNKRVKGFIIKSVCSLIVGFINGFFGGGGGLVCVPTLEKIYKLETKRAHATAIAVMLPLSIVSSIVYILNNSFNYGVLLSVMAGVMLGGALGAILLKRFSGKIIRWIFIVILFLAGVRMII